MQPVDLIRRKRDGQTLSRGEIDGLVGAVVAGTVPDYQVAAFLMAVFLRGMSLDETVALTLAMAASGQRLDLAGIDRPKVDKHSTGGVGDKLSLVVAPLAAACGVCVPMLSGRALAHTGGTIDKLEAIPGLRTGLSLAEVRHGAGSVGCVIAAQTRDIAPADRTLYALRDVTATVDSMPLICASVLSKKLAENLDALVLDVKVGQGAFMKTLADARALAELLVAVGTRAGLRTEALLTRMDAPLGRTIGNALEVGEAIAVLAGRGPGDVEELSVDLTARMLRAGGLVETDDAARARARAALSSGAALECFRRMVASQGGDASVVDAPDRLPQARWRHLVAAERAGFIATLDAETLGGVSMSLGAGRSHAGEAIDSAAGVRLLAIPGDRVAAGDPVLELHYNDQARLAATPALARSAIHIADAAPDPLPLVLARIA